MLGEEFGHLGLDRLRQQGARPVAQHLGERVGKQPWLMQLDHVSIGHGVSLLCWRSGGSDTPTIRRLLSVSPSPTSAYSSLWRHGTCGCRLNGPRNGLCSDANRGAVPVNDDTQSIAEIAQKVTLLHGSGRNPVESGTCGDRQILKYRAF